ncbi:MAG TPA: hypothetical protein VG943_10110 [Caulobacterales bacterium]|nr:hypothetical protein [Caulobacterales bacterium]
MQFEPSVRVMLLGLASWAIPFAVSILFYGPGGVLLVSHALFKSSMVVIGGASGAWLLFFAFRRMAADALSGFLVGLCWMALNLLLDWIVLVPMMHVNFGAYFEDIGLTYALIPIMGAAMGAAVSDPYRARWLGERMRASIPPEDRLEAKQS